jgi:hypothetical protein
MVDAQQVLTQVASGAPASSWQVLRIRTGYLVGRVFIGIFGTLIGGLGAAFGAFFALGGFGGFGGLGPTDGTMALFFFVLPLVVAAIFAIAGVYFLVSGLAALVMLVQSPAQRPVLVLLPEGVVERGGLMGGRIRAVAYADLTHAQMRITTTRTTNTSTGATSTSVQHAVVFTHRDGRRETWKLDGAYGRPDDIISRILTAQIQFSALHTPGGAGR